MHGNNRVHRVCDGVDRAAPLGVLVNRASWWYLVNVGAAALLLTSFAGICVVLLASVAKIGGAT